MCVALSGSARKQNVQVHEMERVMRRKLLSAIVGSCVLLSACAANAWWDVGHQFITQNAVATLAASPMSGALGVYFAAHSSSLVLYSGMEPPSTPHTPSGFYYAPNGAYIQPGTHYIDIDNYQEWSNPATFPHDQTVLLAKYGKNYVQTQGTVPWNAADYERQLSDQMRNARTQADWTNLLYMAGAEAHFLEDLHNPMHLASNYDGQKTGQDGLHARYEGNMLTGHLGTDLLLTPDSAGLTHYDSMIDVIFGRLGQDYPYNADILAADLAGDAAAGGKNYNAAYYQTFYADCKPFTQLLMQDASEVVASTWYTAWVDAGSPNPNPVPEPATMGLLVLGGLALAWRKSRRKPGHETA